MTIRKGKNLAYLYGKRKVGEKKKPAGTVNGVRGSSSLQGRGIIKAKNRDLSEKKEPALPGLGGVFYWGGARDKNISISTNFYSKAMKKYEGSNYKL